MNEALMKDELQKYNFYHVIKLTENLSTPGWINAQPLQEVPLRALRSLDLENKRVLDIGCRDGLFSFEAERLGASEVIGIDNNLSLGAVNLLIPHFKSQVKMHELNLFNLKPETFGMFDVVIFPGVLYHLRYPFWALKLIKDVLHEGGQMILETAIFMDENQHAFLYCPTGSDSPYELTSCTFFNIKGLNDTLSSLGLFVRDSELLYSNKKTDNANFLSAIKSRLRFLSQSKPRTNRATFICDKQSPDDTFTNRYWNKTHQFHTQKIM